MERLDLTDFSGGVVDRFSPHSYPKGAWQRLFGWVIQTDGTLRTQPALQAAAGPLTEASNTVWQRCLTTETTPYIVVRRGTRYFWAIRPLSAVEHATTQTVTWTELTGLSGEDLLPVSEVIFPNDGTNGHRLGLLLHNGNNVANTVAVVLHDTDAAPSTLTTKTYADFYPANDAEEAVPKGTLGCIWGDRLIIGGRTEWLSNEANPFSPSNKRAYNNYLWFSEAGDMTSWDPLSVVQVGGPTGSIVGVEPVDLGLLVFKTGHDSVWLLRGVPSDFEVELLASGLGAATTASLKTAALTKWSHTNTVVWINAAGEIWHTNGQHVERLDGDHLRWRRGNAGVKGIATYGTQLVAYMGDDGWWALNALGDDTYAWTEWDAYALPTTLQDGRSIQGIGDQLWFPSTVQAGANYYPSFRFNKRNDADLTDAPGFHGQRDLDGLGPEMEPEIVTPVLSGVVEGNTHDKTFWHRAGLRWRSPKGGDGYLRLVDVFDDVYDGLWSAQYDPGLANVGLAEVNTQRLLEYVFPLGLGGVNEASVAATFEGDVELHGATLWLTKARPRRSGPGWTNV